MGVQLENSNHISPSYNSPILRWHSLWTALRPFWGHWTSFIKYFFQKILFFMLFWPSEEGLWTLIASIASEVKNNYVHVTMKGILNKISKINFSVGCRVRLWCRLFQIPRSFKILRLRRWVKTALLFPSRYLKWWSNMTSEKLCYKENSLKGSLNFSNLL